MARTPLKLAQGYLTTTLAAMYTVPASKRTQITEIWLANTNAQLSKNVVLTAGDLVFKDVIGAKINLPAKETVVISETKLVLTASATLGAYVDIAVTGTAQGSTATNTITLSTASSTTDDYYNGAVIEITNNSPAGVLGLSKLITDYTGSTKLAILDSAWSTSPSNASTYHVGGTYLTLFGIEEDV